MRTGFLKVCIVSDDDNAFLPSRQSRVDVLPKFNSIKTFYTCNLRTNERSKCNFNDKFSKAVKSTM